MEVVNALGRRKSAVARVYVMSNKNSAAVESGTVNE